MPASVLARHELIARAVIVRDGALLVNRAYNKRLQQEYLALPGGHADPGESCTAALERELREELEATIEVGDLYFVSEQIYAGRKTNDSVRHELVLFFACRLASELSSRDGRVLSPEESKSFQWLPLAGLATANLMPPALKARLTRKPARPGSSPHYVFEDRTQGE